MPRPPSSRRLLVIGGLALLLLGGLAVVTLDVPWTDGPRVAPLATARLEPPGADAPPGTPPPPWDPDAHGRRRFQRGIHPLRDPQ